MKKHFILLSALCVLLTSCDNYTSSHQGQPGSGSAGQQRGSTTDASGRPGGPQGGPQGGAAGQQQPGGPAGQHGIDANRGNPRDQGR